MPFSISITKTFSAAHAIRLYDGSLEPLHGHNWQVIVTATRDSLDSIGVVLDFHELEAQLAAIIHLWQNANLNDQPEFASLNPTAENVAAVIADRLRVPAPARLHSVAVTEAPGCVATFYAEGLD